LEDGHWEPLAGHGGQEEALLLVDFGVAVLEPVGLDEQVGQPVFEQVAVAQDDPIAFRGPPLDRMHGFVF